MERSLVIPIRPEVFEKLRRLAEIERRRPQDQAARLLEQAVARRAIRTPEAER